MRGIPKGRPSPALIVAIIALIAATSGAAIALPGKNSVKSNDIAKNAVKSKHIKKGNVKSSHLKKNAVKGSKVKNGSLSHKDLGDYLVFNEGPVNANEDTTLAGARDGAPEIPVYSDGGLEIYAKCYRDTTGNTIEGAMFARTDTNGALLEGNNDLPGGGATLLDTTTLETDRVLDDQTENAANQAEFDEAEGILMSADGSVAITVLSRIGAKQGDLPGGNGAYGAGNVCLFGAAILG